MSRASRSGPVHGSIRSELRPMFRLALPLALGELGWVMMSIVDTIMVGRMRNSALAIGATSLGGGLFYTVTIFSAGLLLGLDTLISQSFGRGDTDDCNHSLAQALYIALGLTPCVMMANWLAPLMLRRFGIEGQLVAATGYFLHALNFSTLPLFIYFALRRYLQALNHVGVIMFALVSANLVNLLFNWAFIYGHLGFHAMGVAGSGWSTCVARTYMAAVLGTALVYYGKRDHLRLQHTPLALDVRRIRTLLRLGGPVALQILAEIAAFTAITVLAGKLGPVALAAHQVALNCASFTFMVPLGVSAATAVRVGQAFGAGDLHQARRSGYAGLILGCGFMALGAVAFLLAPRILARIYTPDLAIIGASVAILRIAAAFQLFDGLQIVVSGALRGLGDTRTSMAVTIAGYWLFGVPLAMVCCFHFHLGVNGLWLGVSAGLIAIGVTLLGAWRRSPIWHSLRAVTIPI